MDFIISTLYHILSAFLNNLGHKSFYNFKIICYNYSEFKDKYMNNKVKIIVASFAVGMAAVLTGCGGCGGCMGCGGDTGPNNTLTRSNWFTGTSYSGIQPSFISGNEKFSPEIITYEVDYDKTGASNAFVELEYSKGSFTTTFYAVQNWASRIESAIPEGYAPKKADEVVYYYKTELVISVRYKMKTGDKAQSPLFNDHVVTESYFRASGKNLQPLYSRQEIKSTSPANYQPANLEDAYQEVDVKYENFYNDARTRLLSVTYDKDGKESERKELDVSELDYTLFDNSSLYIAVRAMKLSSPLSETITLFSAAAGGIDTYAVITSDAALTAQERKNFTDALTAQNLYYPKDNDEGVPATAVAIAYAGSDLHGTTQTAWYASITNDDNNVSRATMLKLSVPISFSLGTLVYSLKEVNSTLWNG